MIRVGISAELERRLRAWDPSTAIELISEIIALIDAERDKQAQKPAGVGYRAIVDALREGLGDRLALPTSPSTVWIVRQVNRARELGLDVEQIKVLGRQAARTFRGSVELEYVLRSAVRLLQESKLGLGRDGVGSAVRTGRED